MWESIKIVQKLNACAFFFEFINREFGIMISYTLVTFDFFCYLGLKQFSKEWCLLKTQHYYKTPLLHLKTHPILTLTIGKIKSRKINNFEVTKMSKARLETNSWHTCVVSCHYLCDLADFVVRMEWPLVVSAPLSLLIRANSIKKQITNKLCLLAEWISANYCFVFFLLWKLCNNVKFNFRLFKFRFTVW